MLLARYLKRPPPACQTFLAARSQHLCSAATTTTPPQPPPLRFEDLPIQDLFRKNCARQGLKTLTAVQAATLPPLLAGKDVVAKARTGTGKTLAFLIPTLESMARSKKTSSHIRALVLSPTRELACQIAEAAAEMTVGGGGGGGGGRALRCGVMYGGRNIKKDRALLAGPPLDLLVATPGRLWDHLSNGNELEPRLAGLQTLVLDEGDRLLDQGFRRDILKICAKLPRKRQSLCFSATMPPALDDVLGEVLLPDRDVIDCVGSAPAEETASRVELRRAVCDMNDILPAAAAVVASELRQQQQQRPATGDDSLAVATRRKGGKVIVFCPTANQAQFTSTFLANLGVKNDALHSRKSQAQRTRISTRFRDAASGVIVASDVAARGVDYPDVSLVVQLGLPDSRESFVHRTGRTGRAGKTGKALLLLSDWEQTSAARMLSGLKLTDDTDGVAALLRSSSSSSSSSSTNHGIGSTAAQHRKQAVDTIHRDSPEMPRKAYQAFLGYYNGRKRELGLSSEQLVATANHFAEVQLGFGDDGPPAMNARTVRKMGLEGTAGLRMEKKGKRGGRRQQQQQQQPPLRKKTNITAKNARSKKRGRGGGGGEQGQGAGTGGRVHGDGGIRQRPSPSAAGRRHGRGGRQ